MIPEVEIRQVHPKTAGKRDDRVGRSSADMVVRKHKKSGRMW